MRLALAESNDDRALREFYAESSLHGPVDLRVERPGNFFDQYRLQSDDYSTFLLKTDKDRVVGIATIIFRKAFLKDKFETIGYCTDLRIAPSRQAIMEWTDHFTPLLEQLTHEKGCHYFFSAIARNQGRAYNALVRPRSVRRHIPRYYQLGRFEIVSVLGRLPFAPPPLRTLVIRHADAAADFEALAAYLRKKTEGRLLAYEYSAEFLKRRLETWPGLTDRNFILAEDRRGNIVGCVAPWDSAAVQTFSVHQYNGFSKTLRNTMNLLALTRMTSRLPRTGQRLNFDYLTHFHADNPDIFYSLLYEAYEHARPNKFLVYSQFIVDPTTRPPKSFAAAKVPFSLYTVLSPKTPLPDFLRMPRVRAAPDFELALL
ncbi:MAG TPA: hypothetical protein VFV50_16940 [Bdellovibrionales bacterium]|nr:hypothetical protein [Bdellovibrionales bacterium]